jgi:hypothetical protein
VGSRVNLYSNSYQKIFHIDLTGSPLQNDILEGTNRIIQEAKDSARGFRSTQNFIITIYMMMIKLEFNLPA